MVSISREDPTLLKPDAKFKTSYLEGIGELIAEGYLKGKLDVHAIASDFESYLEGIAEFEFGKNIPDGFSAQTELWLIREPDHYIGTLKIRHQLCNDYLSSVGGNIGYYIRPTDRARGYGNLILKLGLCHAKTLGLDKVLITCNEENLKSRKVIEGNGGKFESKAFHERTGTMNRYWIKL
jgi:predicted acetyltransferase